MNGDDKPDCVFADRTKPAHVGVALGNGDGTFQDPVLRIGPKGVDGITVGDFNGDGKPDIATGYGDSVCVLLNCSP